ncbi:N-acyl-D-aspartate deacylase [Rhodococcus opacus]|uniref:N-acyl-D-aspartate deacylase n=1 Tax=Rhodococcus opacus TaxID=37919 RepID=A0A1B1KEU5_RHOOP|nr:D-aminoacylase [Rhodococcus opacus]ANS31144.1 N-acyl-D-aspartate deacylase [Rhodococcus opacus]
MQYDLTLTGGDVIDGTGTPRVRRDVAIAGGQIAAIGPGPFPAPTTIDVSGCIIAPGFIDLHSHADFTLESNPAAVTQIHQGVTTLIVGNCGHSPFPATNSARLRRATLFDDTQLSWTWTDAGGFGAALSNAAPAVNVGLQVGHNALRLEVLGDDDRQPTASELTQMCSLIERSATQPGVVGFSSGLIYAPGVFADSSEMCTLVAAAARAGLLYSTHMRNETSQLIAAVEEAIAAAELSQARLEISHLKAMGPENWGSVKAALDLIDAARARGVDVAADVYPYTASSTTLASRLPKWAIDGGNDALLERLADPETRNRMATELRARFGRDIDPEGVVLAELPEGPYRQYIGQSIAEIGRLHGCDPAETLLNVLAEHHATVTIVNHAMSHSDVATVLSHPWTSVASDGWTMTATGEGCPHPRSFGTFARVLGKYVREEHTLTLEEAIRKMTSLPASRIGVTNRGTLQTGLAADIVVFDPSTIIDNSTFDNPWHLATGVKTVLVNGVLTLFDGRMTGNTAGRLLQK